APHFPRHFGGRQRGPTIGWRDAPSSTRSAHSTLALHSIGPSGRQLIVRRSTRGPSWRSKRSRSESSHDSHTSAPRSWSLPSPIVVGAALAATAVLTAVLASRSRSAVGKRLARLAPRAQLPNRVRSVLVTPALVQSGLGWTEAELVRAKIVLALVCAAAAAVV